MKKVTYLFAKVGKLKKPSKALYCVQYFVFRLMLGTCALSVVDRGWLLALFLRLVVYLLRS